MSHPLEDALENLVNIKGVQGACLHHDALVLLNRWPPQYAEAQVAACGEAIRQIARGFQSAARRPQQYYFQFEEGALFIAAHDRHFLSVLLRGPEPLALVGKMAWHFLRDHYQLIASFDPAALPSARRGQAEAAAWTAFVEGLAAILQKLLGAAMSQRLIARVLQEAGIDPKAGLPKERFHELGFKVLLQIPNRAKQAALRQELDVLVEKCRNL